MKHGEAIIPRPASSERPHIAGLDGLRGVAILAVMWSHFRPHAPPPVSEGWPRLAHNACNAGWVGVDLFFVLSGFLITGNLLSAKTGGDALPTASGRARYFGHFYARRALRIFPLYYAALAGAVIALRAFGDSGDQSHLRDVAPWLWLHLANIPIARGGWVLGFKLLTLNHFWSLAVEEQFYLVWPLVIYFCRRRTLVAACIAAIVLSPALRWYWVAIDGNNYAASTLMPCRADAFAAGALIALTRRTLGGAMWPDQAAASRLARVGGLLIGAAATLFAPTFIADPVMDVLGRSVIAAFFAGVILLTIRGRPWRFLTGGLLPWVGKYSYGAYVLHYLLYRTLDQLFPAASVGPVGRYLACVTLSMAAAWLSWHVLEKPFLSLKRYFPANPEGKGDSTVHPAPTAAFNEGGRSLIGPPAPVGAAA